MLTEFDQNTMANMTAALEYVCKKIPVEKDGHGTRKSIADAMVASALQGIPNLSWHAIRNASDPQISDPENKISQAGDAAAQIYAKYGGLTTAASVIATWAIIHAAIN